MELQLQLRHFKEVKSEAHSVYEQIRTNLPSALVETIVDRLVTDVTLDLHITKQEWIHCIGNHHVRKLLDDMNVPRQCRVDLFDMVDSDASGKITASELKHIIPLFNTPAQYVYTDLLACKFKVQAVQRHLYSTIEPRLIVMQNQVSSFNDRMLDIWKSLAENGANHRVAYPEKPESDVVEKTKSLSAKVCDAAEQRQPRVGPAPPCPVPLLAAADEDDMSLALKPSKSTAHAARHYRPIAANCRKHDRESIMP